MSRYDHTTAYVHDAHDGQVVFALGFDIEPYYDGKTDGWPVPAHVTDVEPLAIESNDTGLGDADDFDWLEWFAANYQRDAEFRAAVDAVCLRAANKEVARAGR